MADRPILFSAPMVLALLAGTKTQTRRILKPQPNMLNGGKPLNDGRGSYSTEGGWKRIPIARGDRLWVREAWRCNGWAIDVATIFYGASEGEGYTAMCEQYPVADKKPLRITSGWRPSIHMPRWASRLTLTVTDVRVERLQDISEADAIAEGCGQYSSSTKLSRPFNPDWKGIYREGYAELWNEINGSGAWEANPWVVAYTFTVQNGNIDKIGGAA